MKFEFVLPFKARLDWIEATLPRELPCVDPCGPTEIITRAALLSRRPSPGTAIRGTGPTGDLGFRLDSGRPNIPSCQTAERHDSGTARRPSR